MGASPDTAGAPQSACSCSRQRPIGKPSSGSSASSKTKGSNIVASNPGELKHVMGRRAFHLEIFPGRPLMVSAKGPSLQHAPNKKA